MSAWGRIDAWLQEHAPAVFAQLRPPVKSADVERLEATLGRRLPGGLLEAYRAHDGAIEDATTIFGAARAPKKALWARYMYWLSIERVREQLAFMRDLGEFPGELLPIAEDAGGNLIVVDVDSGAVGAWDHEEWSVTPLAPDFAAWMGNLADDMEANLVATDEEDEDFPALMLLDRPRVEATAPQITPDRPARVLVAVMLERKMIALAKKADIEPLIKELTGALEQEDPDERLEKVVAILEDNAAIEELFADDDTIEELLEELG